MLREGNSDRRAPASVKAFARKHPHSMGAWSDESKSHVATMGDGDFRSTEQSVTIDATTSCGSSTSPPTATVTVLKDGLAVQAGEIVDAAVMRRAALDAFLAEQIADAKAKGVLFSLHLKATMMKVSDPIIFGHAVRAFFADVFAEHGDALDAVGANPNNGLGERAHRDRAAARATSARRSRRRSARDLRGRPRPRDGRLRPRDHEPARPERRDHRRVDAGDDPRVRARCGTRPASSRTPRR